MTRVKKSKIRSFARGQQCQIRYPGICNRDPETVVACHLGGGGMAAKQPDLFVAFGCSDCHNEADRRTQATPADQARRGFLEGILRTQRILLDAGLVRIDD